MISSFFRFFFFKKQNIENKKRETPDVLSRRCFMVGGLSLGFYFLLQGVFCKKKYMKKILSPKKKRDKTALRHKKNKKTIPGKNTFTTQNNLDLPKINKLFSGKNTSFFKEISLYEKEGKNQKNMKNIHNAPIKDLKIKEIFLSPQKKIYDKTSVPVPKKNNKKNQSPEITKLQNTSLLRSGVTPLTTQGKNHHQGQGLSKIIISPQNYSGDSPRYMKIHGYDKNRLSERKEKKLLNPYGQNLIPLGKKPHILHGSSVGSLDNTPILRLVNTHTGDRFLLRRSMCQYQKHFVSSMKSFSYFCRDHRRHAVYNMDGELLYILGILGHHFGIGKEVRLISGYRHPKSNAMLRQKSSGVAENSFHCKGKALDIKIENVPNGALSSFLRKLPQHRGGVGRYSSFVHFDTRGSKVFWGG